MAGATEGDLVTGGTSQTNAVAAGAVGLAVLLFALALAALFLSEIAPTTVREVVKPGVEILEKVGVPVHPLDVVEHRP